MREQSHLDEMRAAIRGDRERMLARRRADAEPVSLESLPARPPKLVAVEPAPEEPPAAEPDPAPRLVAVVPAPEPPGEPAAVAPVTDEEPPEEPGAVEPAPEPRTDVAGEPAAVLEPDPPPCEEDDSFRARLGSLLRLR